MKPKTKLEIELDAVNRKIKPISKAKENRIIERIFPHYGYRTKKIESCFSCGATWDFNYSAKCPECGRTLTYLEDKKRSIDERDYVSLVETFKEYQVIRYFYVSVWSRIRRKAVDHYLVREVVRHIIKNDGTHAVFTIKVNGMLQWTRTDGWALGDSELTLKHYEPGRHNIGGNNEIFKSKVIPELYRNGFNGNFHNFTESYFILMLLNTPHFETLLKAGQIPLLIAYGKNPGDVEERWQSVKICLRNNYYIEDGKMWIDYLDLLEHFNMDLLNSKNVCPADLRESHNILMRKKRAQQERQWEREERERELTEIQKRKKQTDAARKYRYVMKMFFGIMITDGEIEIVPLKTIQDFKIEEKIHDHCVYTNAYYAKENSLILSARIGDKRLETIEFKLDTLKVAQCQGYDNQLTDYHDRIMKLMEKNIKVIQKAKAA